MAYGDTVMHMCVMVGKGLIGLYIHVYDHSAERVYYAKCASHTCIYAHSLSVHPVLSIYAAEG